MKDECWRLSAGHGVLCDWERERIIRRIVGGHGVVCEWERERRSWRCLNVWVGKREKKERRSWKCLKEDEKEDLCVGDGGLEKNSERLIGFWFNFWCSKFREIDT